MSSGGLSPDVVRLKPLSLLKRSRASLVTVVLDTATQRHKVARCLRLPPGGSELALLEGLDRAARQLKAVAHPSLPVFDRIVEGAGGTWMLFEYLPGSLLTQYLGREATLPDPWIIWWLFHLLQGFDALHTLTPPIVVGYLEPGDVVVDKDRLWITDLGLFEDIFPEVAAVGLADHPFVHFIAPERRNMPQPTPASDLFSAGALAFWLVTGRAPVVGSQLDSGPLREALMECRPQFPPAVGDLVVELLSYYPSHRPTSAKAALERLCPWVVDVTGQRPPEAAAREDVYAAAATRGVEPAPVRPPPPVSCKTSTIPTAPPLPPAQEFLEDARWAIRRRPWRAATVLVGMVAGVALVVVVALSGRLPAGPQPVLRVESGLILGRPDTPGSRWHPLDHVAAHTALATTGESAVLRFSQSRLQLESNVLMECQGKDGTTLQLTLKHGNLTLHTGAGDAVHLHLSTTQLMAESQSDVAVEGDVVVCHAGQVRVGSEGAWQTLHAGGRWPP